MVKRKTEIHRVIAMFVRNQNKKTTKMKAKKTTKTELRKSERENNENHVNVVK